MILMQRANVVAGERQVNAQEDGDKSLLISTSEWWAG